MRTERDEPKIARYQSLTTKTIVLLLASTLLALLTTILPLMSYGEKLLKNTILQGLDGQASATVRGIDLVLEEGLREINAISIALPAASVAQGRLSDVEPYLKQARDGIPTFRSGIFILDRKGKFLID